MLYFRDRVTFVAALAAIASVSGSGPLNNNKAPTTVRNHEEDGMCGMNMYFCNSSTVMLWFPNWYTQDLWTEYIPSCVAIIAMAVFFEWFRAFIRDFEKASGEKLFLVGTDADANLIPIKRHHGPDTTTRVLRAVLHGLQVCISYFLMLASMTMNSGVFASICIGAAIGFYMFGGNSKPGEDQEHCH